MRVLFVNYINSKSPKDKLNKYYLQHRLFATSVFAKQPNGIASLISGKKEKMFVEALTELREIKKRYDHPVFYIDNDCILMDKIDSVFEYDFDVGVIYRYHWEQYGGRHDCLGGFLLFPQKRPDVEDEFLGNLIENTEYWYQKEKKEKKPWFYDQFAISDLVGSPPKERSKFSYEYAMPFEPVVKDVYGAKVLFLSANEWACPMTVHLPEKVKIIHYNHALWPNKYKTDALGQPFFRGKIQPAQTVPPM